MSIDVHLRRLKSINSELQFRNKIKFIEKFLLSRNSKKSKIPHKIYNGQARCFVFVNYIS